MARRRFVLEAELMKIFEFLSKLPSKAGSFIARVSQRPRYPEQGREFCSTIGGGGVNSYKIAILYICIGPYKMFWKEFFESSESNFLPHHHKEYFIFTDSPTLYQSQNPRIHLYPQEDLGWPHNTLKRFEMFLRAQESLQSFDYIFFFNSNVLFARPIGEEFLPLEEDLLVVQHPGYYHRDPDDFTYDRNPQSLAYIPKGEGEVYVCGGINGGKAKAFLHLIQELAHRTQIDLSKGIIALWHDESHLNAYIWKHKNYKLLDAGYCYPHWKIPFEKKIYLREKEKYFDVRALKNLPKSQAGGGGLLKRFLGRS